MSNNENGKQNKMEDLRSKLTEKGLFSAPQQPDHTYGAEKHYDYPQEHNEQDKTEHAKHQPAPFADELKKRFEKKQ